MADKSFVVVQQNTAAKEAAKEALKKLAERMDDIDLSVYDIMSSLAAGRTGIFDGANMYFELQALKTRFMGGAGSAIFEVTMITLGAKEGIDMVTGFFKKSVTSAAVASATSGGNPALWFGNWIGSFFSDAQSPNVIFDDRADQIMNQGSKMFLSAVTTFNPTLAGLVKDVIDTSPRLSGATASALPANPLLPGIPGLPGFPGLPGLPTIIPAAYTGGGASAGQPAKKKRKKKRGFFNKVKTVLARAGTAAATQALGPTILADEHFDDEDVEALLDVIGDELFDGVPRMLDAAGVEFESQVSDTIDYDAAQ